LHFDHNLKVNTDHKCQKIIANACIQKRDFKNTTTSKPVNYQNGKHTFPVSTTYLIPGIVNDVSATFVATMHSLQLGGGGKNT